MVIGTLDHLSRPGRDAHKHVVGLDEDLLIKPCSDALLNFIKDEWIWAGQRDQDQLHIRVIFQCSPIDAVI